MASRKQVEWTAKNCVSSSSRRRDAARVDSDARRHPHALDETATSALASLFPDGRIDVEDLYGPSARALHARHKTCEAYQRITLRAIAL